MRRHGRMFAKLREKRSRMTLGELRRIDVSSTEINNIFSVNNFSAITILWWISRTTTNTRSIAMNARINSCTTPRYKSGLKMQLFSLFSKENSKIVRMNPSSDAFIHQYKESVVLWIQSEPPQHVVEEITNQRLKDSASSFYHYLTNHNTLRNEVVKEAGSLSTISEKNNSILYCMAQPTCRQRQSREHSGKEEGRTRRWNRWWVS